MDEKNENGLPSKMQNGHDHHHHVKRSKSKRCRRRLSQLLHTHIALITVCVLSALDASCVLGQIICDILIMTEKIHDSEVLEAEAVNVFIDVCPALNDTSRTKALHSIIDILKELDDCNSSPPSSSDHYSRKILYERNKIPDKMNRKQAMSILNEPMSLRKLLSLEIFKNDLSRASASDAHDHHEHTLLEELTHVFHLGSMVILSILVVETFTKMFAMGSKFLHHRLEVFDAFVVTVSWCLDIAFYDGIWAQPGTEAATILIFILPWRVIRIVNSFVLVIQEKDLVQLKIVKQQYRRTVKKANEFKTKAEVYKIETRMLQGLCRKYGALESEIAACAGKRRRISSTKSALGSFASLAMIGAVASMPDLHVARESSDEEENEDEVQISNDELEKKAEHILRSVSVDSGLSTAASPVSFSISPDPTDNSVFSFNDTLESIKTENLPNGVYTKI